METQTLHFRVGADMGRTLQQIAHEHFIYGNDFEKALDTLNLGEGCDEEMRLNLLVGNKILLVDEESQEFIVVDRAEYMHLDSIYPKIDVKEYGEKLQEDINKRGDDFIDGLKRLSSTFGSAKSWQINFDIDSALDFIHGNDKEMIAELHADWQFDFWKGMLIHAREFLETGLKKAEMFRLIAGKTNIDFNLNTTKLIQVGTVLQDIARGELSARYVNVGGTDIPDIGNYIQALQDIDEVMSEGIEPVDILDNYTAGWLSPEGEYYGLNGTMANMLHIQIIEALLAKGIIPDADEVNADSWLEEQGWVRIHGNNIQFGGNLNEHHLGKKNVYITDVQKRMIYDYISNCHQSIIKLGWQMKRYSAGQFLAMDKIAMHKHFEF